MNVRGDLNNSIWKRRPAPDDIVLERKRGRVRVLNDSAGVWQITRETLRYVHQLYQRDTRDYSKLPEHLRPPKQLQVQEVDPQVLTTYAGLLFRDLLDRFDGDVSLAVGAYNGGPGRPNMRSRTGLRGPPRRGCCAGCRNCPSGSRGSPSIVAGRCSRPGPRAAGASASTSARFRRSTSAARRRSVSPVEPR